MKKKFIQVVLDKTYDKVPWYICLLQWGKRIFCTVSMSHTANFLGNAKIFCHTCVTCNVVLSWPESLLAVENLNLLCSYFIRIFAPLCVAWSDANKPPKCGFWACFFWIMQDFISWMNDYEWHLSLKNMA